MSERICVIDGCNDPTRSQGAEWCKKHYHRWYRHGDPLASRQRIKGTCSIEGCNKAHSSKGWCKEHYDRWLRHGDPTVVVDRTSKGWVTGEGYRAIHKADHPLATGPDSRHRTVYEHRVVLFEKIGPGSHECHWCGRPVSWESSWPADADALVTDHLDGVRVNNNPMNLVPSCQPCNVKRVPA